LLDLNSSKISRDSFEATVKGNVTMSCTDGNNIMWYFEKKSHPPISPPIFYGNIFKLHNLKSIHAGYYFCSGICPIVNNPFIAKAKLTVYGKTL